MTAAAPAKRPLEPLPDCTTGAALRPLFTGVVVRPVSLAAVGVILLIAWGRLGDSFGIPSLFWDQHIFTQMLGGVGAALLLGEVCFVAYLLDSGDDWLKCQPLPATPGS